MTNQNSYTIGKDKSILLILPDDVGKISKMIEENFIYHGFRVFYYQLEPFQYKNTLERLINLYRKTILKDKTYKKRRQHQEATEKLQRELATISKKADFALFIRPDLHSKEFINDIKSHTNHSIAYQWDGLDRFPDIFDKINLFDTFYVFDANDISKYPEYKLHLTTNFYFDMVKKNHFINQSTKQTIYFVGAHIQERTVDINKFTKVAKLLGLEIQFFIRCISNAEKEMLSYSQPKDITFFKTNMTYRENLEKVKQADILVDFINNVHKGLSFRIFESIYYQKKLITNNIEVVNYDLYHPNNIFVWDGISLNADELKAFLELPYQPLKKEIIEKYSFKNWINYMLGIEPNISLSM